MTAAPEAIAFRTERQRVGSSEWVVDRRLTVLFVPGEAVELSRLGWRDRDGAEATVDFDGDMGGFLGLRIAADGTPYAWRGVREEGRAGGRPHQLPGVRPDGAGELRLLIEDGGAPPVRVSWSDRAGGGGAVALRLLAGSPAPVSFTGYRRQAGEAPLPYEGPVPCESATSSASTAPYESTAPHESTVPYEGSADGPAGALPRTVEQWRAYLSEFSADMLRVAGEGELQGITPEQRATSWFGYPGASEEQLVALEKRLGTVLPPSYRSFLATSDGWRDISLFMWELRAAEDVALLRDAEPGTWEILRGDSDGDHDGDGDGQEDDGPDDRELMDRAVLVSAEGDAQLWLLDPADVSPDGEWAAYAWAGWYPGLGERHASFAELVAGERATFEEMRGQEGRPVHPEGAAELLARGRESALRGEVDEALAAFGLAARKGSGAGAYLKVILAAFLDHGFTHHELQGVLHHAHVVEAVGEEQISAEAVPLSLLCAAAEQHGEAGRTARVLGDLLPGLPGLPARVASEDDAVSEDDADQEDGAAWEEWAAGYRAPVLPETPAFQQALDTARALASGGATDEAWTVIELALPDWYAPSPHRIAPVVLLTDPVLREVMTPERARAVVFTPRGRATDAS